MTLPSKETLIAMALATLRNFVEGDEHTREEDAKFALDILERYLAEPNPEPDPAIIQEHGGATEDVSLTDELPGNGSADSERSVGGAIPPAANPASEPEAS